MALVIGLIVIGCSQSQQTAPQNQAQAPAQKATVSPATTTQNTPAPSQGAPTASQGAPNTPISNADLNLNQGVDESAGSDLQTPTPDTG